MPDLIQSVIVWTENATVTKKAIYWRRMLNSKLFRLLLLLLMVYYTLLIKQITGTSRTSNFFLLIVTYPNGNFKRRNLFIF